MVFILLGAEPNVCHAPKSRKCSEVNERAVPCERLASSCRVTTAKPCRTCWVCVQGKGISNVVKVRDCILDWSNIGCPSAREKHQLVKAVVDLGGWLVNGTQDYETLDIGHSNNLLHDVASCSRIKTCSNKSEKHL
jgi:hypothetical protein